MTTTPREGTVTLGTISLHYQEWGPADGPALLLLHGVWDGAAIWEPVAAALADRFRVLAVDQRGHGPSSWTDDYRLERWVEDIVGLTTALGITRAAIAGHSAGGIVGFMLASRRPDLVERLIVIDHGPDATDRVRERLGGRTRPIMPPAHIDPALRLPDILDVFDAAAMRSEWERLQAIICPTLIVRAERSDRFPRETAEQMQRLIPDCRLVEIPGSRHTILTDAPDALRAAMQAFLM